MEVIVDGGWAGGLVLSTVRATGLVLASPIFARTVPGPGKIALVVVLGFAFAHPIEVVTTLEVVRGVGVNAMVGIALGWLTGVLYHAFSAAGGMIDFSGGLSVGAVFDPSTGEREATYGRMLGLLAAVLFLVLGGDLLLISGLGESVRAIPLDGSIRLDGGIGRMAAELVGTMLLAAVEIALPALAALFLAEMVLGLATRLVPHFNAFLVGLPAKVLLSIVMVATVVVSMPTFVDGLFDHTTRIISDTIAGLRSQ